MSAVRRRQQRIRGGGFSWSCRIITARSAELNLGGSIYALVCRAANVSLYVLGRFLGKKNPLTKSGRNPYQEETWRRQLKYSAKYVALQHLY
jgi:hypothetical protein